eukprot:jgi/Botrbrau1/8831/Bobra.0335s0018.1
MEGQSFSLTASYHGQDVNTATFAAGPQHPTVFNTCACPQCTEQQVPQHPTILDRYGEVLARSANILASEQVHFKGEYGCAVIAVSDEGRGPFSSTSLDTAHLSLVCLDKWELLIKCSPEPAGATAPVARCCDSTVIQAGSIPFHLLSKTFKRLDELAHLALQLKNDKDGTGKKGHQRTPAFIHTALLAAIGDANAGVFDRQHHITARGGTTDVGMHTGSQARDTSWPLVHQVFRELVRYLHAISNIEQDQGSGDAFHLSADTLFDLTMAQLDAWLVLRQAQLLSADTACSTMLSATMAMLQSTATRAAHLAETGQVLAAQILETICQKAHTQISKAAADRALAAAAKYTLDPCRHKLDDATFGKIFGPLPAPPSSGTGSLCREAVRQRAVANLASLPILECRCSNVPSGGFEDSATSVSCKTSFAQLRQWLKTTEGLPQDALLLQHQARTVERFVFHRVVSHFSQTAELLENKQEAGYLQQVFVVYIKVILQLLESEEGKLLNKSELHSRMSLLHTYTYINACMQMQAPDQSMGKLFDEHAPLGPSSKLSLMHHYNCHQCSYNSHCGDPIDSDRKGEDYSLKLRGNGKVPASLGPGTVDEYDDRECGVWFPDRLSPAMAWEGPHFLTAGFPETDANPFEPVQYQDFSDAYTERFGTENEVLDAYIECRSFDRTPGDRGNLGIAKRGERPRWLSQPAFHAFTTLRSFPHRQLRQLCTSLMKRELPLERHEALFHFGQLRIDVDQNKCFRQWRGEGTAEFEETFKTLHTELLGLADELRDKIREQGSIRLLGEPNALRAWCTPRTIDGFRLQKDPPLNQRSMENSTHGFPAKQIPFHEVARDFAKIALNFIRDLSNSYDSHAANIGVDINSSQQALSALLSKRVALRSAILACLSGRELLLADKAAAIEAMVWINRDRIFQTDEHAANSHKRLMAEVRSIMAINIEDLVDAAAKDSTIISEAVGQILGENFKRLAWEQKKYGSYSSTSFEAWDGPKLYSINILTGTVLVDGLPLGRLPIEIVRHPDYQAAFGDVNFEVCVTNTGVFTTLNPIPASSKSVLPPDHGGRLCKYEFFMAAKTGQLYITEIDCSSNGERLQLVKLAAPSTEQADPQSCLPVRLRSQELHSHWFSHTRQVMLFRPPHFQQRTVDFVAHAAIAESTRATSNNRSPNVLPWKSQPAGPTRVCTYSCRRVDPHLRKTYWVRLIEENRTDLKDELVSSGNPDILRVLSKIESVRYIHKYRRIRVQDSPVLCEEPGPEMIFDLPRLGLEFELKRDGEVVSKEYDGYRLRQRQQLVGESRSSTLPSLKISRSSEDAPSYTLPDFHQYLVLERRSSLPASSRSRRAELLLLMPAGRVHRDKTGNVMVAVPAEADAVIKTHLYEVHARFGHPAATNILARLQLAALYAATSSLLAEPVNCMTGAQIALRLVRQCFSSKPLTQEESSQLQSIYDLAGNLLPSLPLAAEDLDASAFRLTHIHTQMGRPTHAFRLRKGHVDLKTCYFQFAHREACGMGTVKLVGVPGCQVPGLEGVVKHYEEVLEGFVEEVPELESGDNLVYPLATSEAGLSNLEKDMHRELRESWILHKRTAKSQCLQNGGRDLALPINRCQEGMHDDNHCPPRKIIKVPDNHVDLLVGDIGSGLHRQCACNGGKLLTGALVRSATRDRNKRRGLLKEFNPFLSKVSRDRLFTAIFDWMELCVLEDRLSRLAHLAASPADNISSIVQELQTKRVWESNDHIEWLVFEVEGQLQIRPAQFKVAEGLLEDPGAVSQLNMGEGKTRVILPMLALHWANGNGHRGKGTSSHNRGNDLVRLVFLSTLIEEGYTHLHNCLSASLLCRCEADPRKRKRDPILSTACFGVAYPVSKQTGRESVENPVQMHPMMPCTPVCPWLSWKGVGPEPVKGYGQWRILHMQLHEQDWHPYVPSIFPNQLLDYAYIESHRLLATEEGMPGLGRKTLRKHNRTYTTLQAVHELGVWSILDESDELLHYRPRRVLPSTINLEHKQSNHAIFSHTYAYVPLSRMTSFHVSWIWVNLRADMCKLNCNAADGTWCMRVGDLRTYPNSQLAKPLYRLFFRLPPACEWLSADIDFPEQRRSKRLRTSSPHEGLLDAGVLPTSAGVLEPTINHDPQVCGGPLPGAYSGLRLLRGHSLESIEADLRHWIVWALINQPTYDYKWIESLGRQMKETLAQCIIDAKRPVEELMDEDCKQLDASQLQQILALRGLLAQRVLICALTKRNRVDYGVNRSNGAKKRLAIPFRAAQVPADRSEFVHPDVAIVLTHLSYYYDGLSLKEMETALHVLVAMGPNAQEAHFGEWLRLQPDHIPTARSTKIEPFRCSCTDDDSRLDSAAKIDVTNTIQSGNRANYLIEVVLRIQITRQIIDQCQGPLEHYTLGNAAETQVFEERMACTPWHLSEAKNSQVVGFSGTKDNHRLLPLHVHQAIPNDYRVKATDGKMLDLLLDPKNHTPKYFAIIPQKQKPLWKLVVDLATNEGLDAILDCGALLAGASTRDAAMYSLANLELMDMGRFKGVCWYDALWGWSICNMRGHTWARHNSPLLEREAFVIFDEAHCRGADLQLRRGAVGLLTLAPKSTKDKVMQAAGRLRQLMYGHQFVHFAGSTEVTAKIKAVRRPKVGPITAVDTMRWVMGNTVQATIDGIVPWASQGIHYAGTMHAPDRFIEPEFMQLEEMYTSGVAPAPVGEVIHGLVVKAKQRFSEGAEASLSEGSLRVLETVEQRSREYGSGHIILSTTASTVPQDIADMDEEHETPREEQQEANPAQDQHYELSEEALEYGDEQNQPSAKRSSKTRGRVGSHFTNADEECERELEQELEKEKEKEVEQRPVIAATESTWDFSQAAQCQSFSALQNVTGELYSFKAAAECISVAKQDLSGLPWSGRVWCTANYMRATDACPPFNAHLRPLDALLCLPDGCVVVLSEREAEGMLEAMQTAAWRHNSSLHSSKQNLPWLVHLAYLARAHERGEPGVQLSCVAGFSGSGELHPSAVHSEGVVTMKLFNGDTRYRVPQEQAVLRKFVHAVGNSDVLKELVAMHGKLPHLSRSDLDDACKAAGF